MKTTVSSKSVTFTILFGFTSILFIWLTPYDFIDPLVQEDGPIENLTALFYLMGFLLGIYAIIKKRNLTMAITWAILCFLFLGEETSWFQRVFNYSVPAIEAVNAQNEFNLHNLSIFDGEKVIVDGEINLSALKALLLSTQNIFRLGFFGFFLILPLIYFNKLGKKLLDKTNYIQPSQLFIIGIILVFVFSFVLAFFTDLNTKMALAETRELLYSLFILTYVLQYITRNNRIRAN